MDSEDARLETFSKTTRVGKGKKAQDLRWPHSAKYAVSPKVLAEAGFYYVPSVDDPDNVMCFMCKKELGGWDENDNPHIIHWEKCRDRCAWAAARCALEVDKDARGRFRFKDPDRIPSSQKMTEARLKTFTFRKWPHDSAKGHGASSQNLAKAGFVCTPQEDGSDTVTCFYCYTHLRNWDTNDDPLEEHRTSAEENKLRCAFITSLPEPPKTTRAPSRASSAPRRKSTKPAPRADSSSEDDYVSVAEEPVVEETAALGRSTRGRARTTNADAMSTAKTPAVKKSTRGKSGTTKASAPRRGRSVAGSEIETDAAEEPEEAGRRSRARAKKPAAEENEHEEEEKEEEDKILKPAAPSKKGPPLARKTSRKTIVKDEESDHQVDAEGDVAITAKPARKGRTTTAIEPPAKPTRKGSRGKSITRTAPSDAGSDVEVMGPPPVPPARKGSGRSTISRQASMMETSDVEAPAPKVKRQTRSRSIVPAPTTEEEEDMQLTDVVKKPKARVRSKQVREEADELQLDPIVVKPKASRTKTRTDEEDDMELTAVVAKSKGKKKLTKASSSRTATAIDSTSEDLDETSRDPPPKRNGARAPSVSPHSDVEEAEEEDGPPPPPPKPKAKGKAKEPTQSQFAVRSVVPLPSIEHSTSETDDPPPLPSLKDKGKVKAPKALAVGKNISAASASGDDWSYDEDTTPKVQRAKPADALPKPAASLVRQRTVSRTEPYAPPPALVPKPSSTQSSRMSQSVAPPPHPVLKKRSIQSLRTSQAVAPPPRVSPSPSHGGDVTMQDAGVLDDSTDAIDVLSDEDTMAFHLPPPTKKLIESKKLEKPLPPPPSAPAVEESKPEQAIRKSPMDVDDESGRADAVQVTALPSPPPTIEPRTPESARPIKVHVDMDQQPAADTVVASSVRPSSIVVADEAIIPPGSAPDSATAPATTVEPSDEVDLLPRFDPTSLSAEDREMTVEEWLRREMEKELVRVSDEMEAHIREFEERAAEKRSIIAAL